MMDEKIGETDKESAEWETAREGDALVVFSHPEKGVRFRLGPQPYMPWSGSRILLSGPPGSGKRNLIINIIAKMVPPPSIVHLVHCCPDTTEYNVLTGAGIPLHVYSPDDFPTNLNIVAPESDADEDDQGDGSAESDVEAMPRLTNPVVVIDEVTTEQLKHKMSMRFERMVNYVATHNNATVLCSIQSLLNLPPKARRGFNHFVLWRQRDSMLNQLVAHRSGISPDELERLFGLCETRHDFIWIDCDADADSEWRYRLCMIEPIRFVSLESLGLPVEAAIVAQTPETVAMTEAPDDKKSDPAETDAPAEP